MERTAADRGVDPTPARSAASRAATRAGARNALRSPGRACRALQGEAKAGRGSSTAPRTELTRDRRSARVTDGHLRAGTRGERPVSVVDDPGGRARPATSAQRHLGRAFATAILDCLVDDTVPRGHRGARERLGAYRHAPRGAGRRGPMVELEYDGPRGTDPSRTTPRAVGRTRGAGRTHAGEKARRVPQSFPQGRAGS